jgi:hypothetical protein
MANEQKAKGRLNTDTLCNDQVQFVGFNGNLKENVCGIDENSACEYDCR